MGQRYTGITVDIERRFNEHQQSGPRCAKALKGKGPLTLIGCAKVATHSQALKLERHIKRQHTAHKLPELERGQSDKLEFSWQVIAPETLSLQ